MKSLSIEYHFGRLIVCLSLKCIHMKRAELHTCEITGDTFIKCTHTPCCHRWEMRDAHLHRIFIVHVVTCHMTRSHASHIHRHFCVMTHASCVMTHDAHLDAACATELSLEITFACKEKSFTPSERNRDFSHVCIYVGNSVPTLS